MPKEYYSDQEFTGSDLETETLEKADYEYCRFINCKFAKADLSNFGFIDCEFQGCDLSMAKLYETTIRDCTFLECKLVGLQFDSCNDFSFSAEFESCNLNLASFFGVKLNNGLFKDCSLHDVDFTQTELQSTLFENCDLNKTIFSHTALQKADLRTSYNFSIDPEKNRLEGTQFSMQGLPGLLDKYGIVIS